MVSVQVVAAVVMVVLVLEAAALGVLVFLVVVTCNSMLSSFAFGNEFDSDIINL